jgi:hypothetical protein
LKICANSKKSSIQNLFEFVFVNNKTFSEFEKKIKKEKEIENKKPEETDVTCPKIKKPGPIEYLF